MTVYFDGACPLCRREIDFYRVRSRGVSFVDVSSADESALGEGLCPSDALERFHVRTEVGELKSGAAAFAALWRRTPGFAWAGRLFGRGPALVVAEVAYRGFLKVRPLIQGMARRLEAGRGGAATG